MNLAVVCSELTGGPLPSGCYANSPAAIPPALQSIL